MEYQVIPFPRSGNPAQTLSDLVEEHAAEGWIYKNHQYSDKLSPGKDGCFGIGATPDVVTHVGLIMFER